MEPKAAFAILGAGLVALTCLGAATAEEARRSFRLIAPPKMAEDGFLSHLIPRFALKTGVRPKWEAAPPPEAAAAFEAGAAGMIWLDDPGLIEAATAAGAVATPIIAPSRENGDLGDAGKGAGKGARKGVVTAITDPGAAKDARAPEARFLAWLTSPIGRRAIAAYKPDGAALYAPFEATAVAAPTPAPAGDRDLGAAAALRHCGRCHVVNDANRFAGIGSTPSFGALRGLPRWRQRFEAFWTLNPHPAFTQIDGVTAPFAPDRPSPIAPMVLTMAEAEAILAFVAAMPPKDLGAPLAFQ